MDLGAFRTAGAVGACAPGGRAGRPLARRRAFMRARRLESLNVNVIYQCVLSQPSRNAEAASAPQGRRHGTEVMRKTWKARPVEGGARSPVPMGTGEGTAASG